MIEVDVEGRPAPKGSRIFARTKQGKSYSRPASKYEKPWVEVVKTATQIAVRHATATEPPYHVALTFRLQAAKSRKRTDKPWPTAHDLDKLARAVVDGLVQGGALLDDRHVTALTVRKRFARHNESPGVTARVSTDAQMQEILLAA